ncbi:hypothetical protein HUG10_03620 [Halorarum halophilum]|uniref:CHAT domain-containing protein n=1 Tax=Halorarum halophilum TaxID=2743090 RepID=A0A7D5L2L8_9EURY|nr:hypothetical protein [Halobaculum halophilum]QLG26683.1 hypothetical protein HUG10_03620 [Halobaculum halophilum]
MQIETTEDGLHAVDAAKTSLSVTTDGWVPDADGPSLGCGLDVLGFEDARIPETVVSGRTRSLSFPPYHATVRSLDGDDTYVVGSQPDDVPIPDGRYVLTVDGAIRALVRFDGAATVSQVDYERLVVEFPEPTAVTVGFDARVGGDTGTVTVPRTPEGVARALSVLPAGYRTTTPDRTFPAMRGPQPTVAFGDEVSVPRSVRDRLHSTDLELRLPPELRYLFTGAPLASYLGATVSVERGTTPTLVAPGTSHEFPELPLFQREASALLRRVFLCDCLVRSAGPHGEDLDEAEHLDALSIDAETTYESPFAERVERYLDAPFEDVSDRLPDWHLSMYVEPSYSHVGTLPYLLEEVPFVFLPDADELADNEWLDRSLSAFYRGTAGDVASIDLVRPNLGPGRVHGWLADGVPIDVFKTLPEAYENRAAYLDAAGEPISIVAILNDGAMREEYDDAAARYRERAAELNIDIDIREDLTVDELARTFEERHDLLHYIGHCETDGLRCADGYLSARSIEESNVQTFFLNACGSYYEGEELVRKGSVAGGVTFNEVLDSQAATVGTTFARLMTLGYCIERALDAARRRIMTGKDYAVVGDGTHVLTQTDTLVPPNAEIVGEGDDDEFTVTYRVDGPRFPGATHHCHLRRDDGYSLLRTTEEYIVGRQQLREFLSYSENPIVYDGDLRWRDEVAERLLD